MRLVRASHVVQIASCCLFWKITKLLKDAISYKATTSYRTEDIIVHIEESRPTTASCPSKRTAGQKNSHFGRACGIRFALLSSVTNHTGSLWGLTSPAASQLTSWRPVCARVWCVTSSPLQERTPRTVRFIIIFPKPCYKLHLHSPKISLQVV